MEAEFTMELREKRGGWLEVDGGKAQSCISDWQGKSHFGNAKSWKVVRPREGNPRNLANSALWELNS